MTSIAVACAWRYEPPWMLEDWRTNVAWADHVIAIDTNGAADPWIPRVIRVERMIQAAEQAGADWLFILDVDERLEDGAEKHLRSVADAWRPGKPFAFKFTLLEMFTTTEYRVDGAWGRKTRRRFFHIASRRADMTSPCTRLKRPYILHTKHINPENDLTRAKLHNSYNTWDRAGRTGEGFDYLASRRGMELRPLPKGVRVTPPIRPWLFEMPAS